MIMKAGCLSPAIKELSGKTIQKERVSCLNNKNLQITSYRSVGFRVRWGNEILTCDLLYVIVLPVSQSSLRRLYYIGFDGNKSSGRGSSFIKIRESVLQLKFPELH